MIQSSGYFSPLLFIYIFRPSSSVSIRWLKVKMVWVTLCRKVKGLSRPSQIPNLCEELSKEPLQSGASPPLLPPPLPPSPAATKCGLNTRPELSFASPRPYSQASLYLSLSLFSLLFNFCLVITGSGRESICTITTAIRWKQLMWARISGGSP